MIILLINQKKQKEEAKKNEVERPIPENKKNIYLLYDINYGDYEETKKEEIKYYEDLSENSGYSYEYVAINFIFKRLLIISTNKFFSDS